MKQKNNSKRLWSTVNELEYDSAFTFIYSPREGTPAAKMVDNVPMEVKKNALIV